MPVSLPVHSNKSLKRPNLYYNPVPKLEPGNEKTDEIEKESIPRLSSGGSGIEGA